MEINKSPCRLLALAARWNRLVNLDPPVTNRTVLSNAASCSDCAISASAVQQADNKRTHFPRRPRSDVSLSVCQILRSWRLQTAGRLLLAPHGLARHAGPFP